MLQRVLIIHSDYADKFKKMKSQNKNLKLKQFCEIVNINF